jgi:hypothetical protein
MAVIWGTIGYCMGCKVSAVYGVIQVTVWGEKLWLLYGVIQVTALGEQTGLLYGGNTVYCMGAYRKLLGANHGTEFKVLYFQTY